MAAEAIAEAWSALGRQLAASRRAAGLSQERLAPLCGYSRSTVANAETGRQRVPRGFWESCDAALDTGTALARGHDEVMAVSRRGDLWSAVSAHQARMSVGASPRSVSAGMLRPGSGGVTEEPADLAQVESVRQWLNSTLTGGAPGGAGLDSWEQAVSRHGQATRTRPAGEHVIELAADMAELGVAIRQCRSASSLRGLTRVAAHMSGMMCLLFVKLDEREAFRRWADTARSAAAEAQDPATLSWVLAQEAYGHFYSGDLGAAVRTAQHAQSLARRAPAAGAALAAALEARAQAARGRAREARNALGRAETVLSRMRPESASASALGYNESQFRFHEGNVYTRLRDTRRALPAQERALKLCLPGDYTDWALTRLDRASCLAQDGDAPAAVAYASETATRLQAAHRHGIIALRGRQLVRILPAAYRAAPEVREFASLLAPVADPARETASL